MLFVQINGPPLEEFPFDAALEKWHGAVQRRTTTAPSTVLEKEEEAESAVQPSRSTTAESVAIGGNASTEPSRSTSSAAAAAEASGAGGSQAVEDVVRPLLNAMPGNLAIQLHEWLKAARQA